MVEPLLSIKKLNTKDIEHEQRKLKVELPKLPKLRLKPTPKWKDLKSSAMGKTPTHTGTFKVLTRSLIK